MNLAIVGTGAMGKVLYDYAYNEGTFQNIFTVEPLDKEPWPSQKMDLIIDFSNPAAIKSIYDYCRNQGGNIPVVLATTGYGTEEEKIIDLLEKICPLKRSTNFSKGVEVMNQLCAAAFRELGEDCHIRMTEIHHTKKKDAPSGTAKTLCRVLNINPEDEEKVFSLRMGTVFGEHTVYFAMEDEILEIKHTALSKKIFAIGALEAGKSMVDD